MAKAAKGVLIFRHVGAQFPGPHWTAIATLPNHLPPPQWPRVFKNYRFRYTILAAYYVYAGTRTSLQKALRLYKQMGQNPFAENRPVNGIIPAIHWKRGDQAMFLSALMDAHDLQHNNRPQHFDIVNSTISFLDVATETLLTLARIKVLHNLQEAREALVLDRVLPPEMLLNIQNKVLETYGVLVEGIEDLKLQLISRNGLDQSISRLEQKIRTSIHRIDAINPFLLVGFFWPAIFIRLPACKMLNINNPASQVPDNLEPISNHHQCSPACHNRLEHMAQLAFMDIFVAFDKPSLHLMCDEIEKVVPTSVDTNLRRFMRLFGDPTLYDHIDAINGNTVLI